MLRLGNMILTGLGDDLYLRCYAGTRNFDETIPTADLTGTIDIVADSLSVVGTTTQFMSELRSGQYLFVDSFLLVVNQITDDTHCTVYKAPTSNVVAATAERMPVLYEIDSQRGTQIQGNAVQADKGTILATGFGTVRINGQPLSGITSVSVSQSVGTGADDAAVGTLAWTNPSNITTGGDATAIPADGVTTHYLKGTNLGFAIDPAATIVGIGVTIRRSLSGTITTETIADSEVKIVLADGSIGATNKASAVNWPTIDTNIVYGGATDLWGETWTPADINDTDFGVVMSATAADPATDAGTLKVVSYTITVYYTMAGGMILNGSPQIGIYDRATNTYAIYAIGLNPPVVNPTVTSVPGGTKNMQPGNFSARLVPARTATGGYGNPGPQIPFTIINAGDQAKFDVSLGPAMDTANGQNAWDIYATELMATDRDQGPWNFVKTVTIADIVGNAFYIDYADAEIVRNGLLDFNNDPPPPSGYVQFLEGEPVWISTRGKLSDTFGPSIRPGKPQDIDAAPADWDVSASPPQNILGATSSLARLYFPTPMSLQQGVYLGSTDPFQIVPSVSMRPYWHVGFSHGYQLVFVLGDLYGYPHAGPTRSTANAEVVAEQFFGEYIAEITQNWIGAQVLVGYDPQLRAVCYFHSGDSLNTAGFWRTRVVLWGIKQQGWLGECFISDDTRDMCVCGIATVNEHLQFLAGGRKNAGIQVDTFQFNTASDQIIEWYASWAGVSAPSQNIAVKAASATGKFTDGVAQIYGYDEDVDIDYAALEAGTDALITFSMGTNAGIARQFRQRFNAPNCGLAILRISGTWDGVGDPDRLDKGYIAGAPTGNRR